QRRPRRAGPSSAPGRGTGQGLDLRTRRSPSGGADGGPGPQPATDVQHHLITHPISASKASTRQRKETAMPAHNFGDFQNLVYAHAVGGDPPRGNPLNKAAIPAVGQSGGDVIVVSANYHEAIGLAVDTQAGVVYVSDISGQIRAVRLDGSGERLVFKA